MNIPLPLTSPKQEWVATNNITQDYVPFCYIQQVVLKVTVLPWEADLTLGDGFRAPLYESFKLLDIVRNYEDKSRWVFFCYYNINSVFGFTFNKYNIFD